VFAEELHSAKLSLFTRVPNYTNTEAQNKSKWVPNPAASSPTQLAMLRFLGKLIGIILRGGSISAADKDLFLVLDWPSLVWKGIVQAPADMSDLRGVDKSTTDILELVDALTTDEQAQYYPFTLPSGEPLRHGEEDSVITMESKAEYIELVQDHYAHLYDEQIAAIRSGIGEVLPPEALRLLSWQEMELMVCGSEEWEVESLQAITQYHGCEAGDAHVKLFWQAMESFDYKERGRFLRFAYGSSRIPAHDKFRLHRANIDDQDHLPVSHSCFFQLDLPRYRTLTLMQDKLRYAFNTCVAIDADGTSRATAALRAVQSYESDDGD
jgi:hypothetical protein